MLDHMSEHVYSHRKVISHFHDRFSPPRLLKLLEPLSWVSHSSLDETTPLLAPPSDPCDHRRLTPATPHDDFRFIRVINEGVSGKVYIAQDNVTQEAFALKVIRKRVHNLAQIINEKDVLCTAAGSPWFLSLEASAHDDTNFYLITTLYPTDLQTELRSRGGRLPVSLARFYAAELICALEALHNYGVIHRDIKPANILLTKAGHVVLADFGMAKLFPEHSSWLPHSGLPYIEVVPGSTGPIRVVPHQPYVDKLDDITHGRMGTIAYAAPEMRVGLPYSYGVDFWSLGVVLFILLTGRFPFGSLGEHYLLRFAPGEVDEAAQSLLKHMLNVNPSKRPNIYELKSHRFFAHVDWVATAARAHPAPAVPRMPVLAQPAPKTLRAPLGKPYADPASDPFPHFAFTSSRLREARRAGTGPGTDADAGRSASGLFSREGVARIARQAREVASLFCMCAE
ncbi:kinase-like domain-containing protein [Gloeopeniophorella convolvens]|nr:kinase-like domain-containing protein [Gloeopeniophorella convolvens]